MYFERIGDSGFVLGRIRTAEAPRAPGLWLRYAAVKRIRAVLPGDKGAIAQPEDAIYPLNVTDADGKPVMAENKYVLHFTKDELRPVSAFWSLTLYDAEGFQVANPLNRFAIGDRDALKFNADGSLDLYIQNEPRFRQGIEPAPSAEERPTRINAATLCAEAADRGRPLEPTGYQAGRLTEKEKLAHNNGDTPRNARLRADARGRDGGVRQKLAAGVRFRRQAGKNIRSF